MPSLTPSRPAFNPSPHAFKSSAPSPPTILGTKSTTPMPSSASARAPSDRAGTARAGLAARVEPRRYPAPRTSRRSSGPPRNRRAQLRIRPSPSAAGAGATAPRAWSNAGGRCGGSCWSPSAWPAAMRVWVFQWSQWAAVADRRRCRGDSARDHQYRQRRLLLQYNLVSVTVRCTFQPPRLMFRPPTNALSPISYLSKCLNEPQRLLVPPKSF